MAIFSISANDTDMGTYSGATAQEALDKYATDAGYANYAEVVEEFGDDATATEIDTAALCAAVAEKTGSGVFEDAYSDGVALAHDGEAWISYKTWQDLAQSIGKNVWDFKA